MATKQKKKETKVPWLHRYRYLIVFVFAFLIYANTIPNDYCMDDELVTTTDPNYPHRLTSQGISAIPQIFKEPYYKDDQGYAYDYRPIVLVTFAIEHSLFGDNPHVSHFINVLLYALLCVLLLRVLSELFKDYNPLIHFIATLIYAAHPIHTEVVASIKNRDEILALYLGLLSFAFLLKAQWSPLVKLVVSVSIFAIALLSKQSIIAFGVCIPIGLTLFTQTTPSVNLLYVTAIALLFIPISFVNSTVNSIILFSSAFCVVVTFSLYIKYPPLPIVKRYLDALISEKDHLTKVGLWHTFTIPYGFAILTFLLLWGIGACLFQFSTYNFYWPFALSCAVPIFVKDKNYKYLFHFFSSTTLGVLLFLSNDFVNIVPLVLLYSLFFYDKNRILPLVTVIPIIVASYIKTLPGFTVEPFLVYTLLDAITQQRFLKLKKNIFFSILFIGFIISLISIISGCSTMTVTEIVRPIVIQVVLLLIGLRENKLLPWLVLVIGLTFVFANSENRPQRLTLGPIVYQVNQIATPSIIPKSEIDRPVSKVESVTFGKSSLEYKLGTTAQAFKKYIILLAVPYPLSFYYGYKIIDEQSIYTITNLATMVFYALLGVAAIFCLRIKKIISFLFVIYLMCIAIYTNLFPPIPGAMADRFLFVPSLGFCILLAYGLLKLFKLDEKNTAYNLDLNLLPKGLKYSIAGVLLVYSALTIARNTQWKDHLTLFAADIGHLENSAQANNLYAVHLMKNSYKETNPQKVQEMRLLAEKHFKQALKVYPEFFNAQYDLGRTQSILGKNPEAEQNFVKAAKMNPEFPTAWLAAADMAMNDKRYADAIRYYSAVPDKFRKDDASFYLRYSYAYFLNQQTDSSLIINKQGASLFPQYPDFYLALGQTFQSQLRIDSAIYYFEKALAINPQNDQLRQSILQLKANKN